MAVSCYWQPLNMGDARARLIGLGTRGNVSTSQIRKKPGLLVNTFALCTMPRWALLKRKKWILCGVTKAAFPTGLASTDTQSNPGYGSIKVFPRGRSSVMEGTVPT